MPTDAWSAEQAVTCVRRELSAIADPQRASEMAAYMRDRYPFFGVSQSDRKPILRRLVADYPVSTQRQYRALVSGLWAEPEREVKYLALALARRWSLGHTPSNLALFRRMIVDGDWWDTVDSLAAHMVGGVLRTAEPETWKVVDGWLRHRNMWLRRTNVICQLARKADTDADRLFNACATLAHEDEFFIRKAIGWALREYAKTAPDAVAAFVVAHRDELSGLSIREATKHLGPL